MEGRTTVVMVTPYPPQGDGIGVHAAGLVRALEARDQVRVEVVTRRGRGRERRTQPGVLPVLRASPLCLVELNRTLSAVRPAVIHLQFNLPAFGIAWVWAALAASTARRRIGSRIVWTAHEVRRDLSLLGWAGPLLYRAMGAVSDGIIVYTDEARHLLAARCGVREDKVTVMAHGAPEAFPRPSPERSADLLASYGLSTPPILAFGYLHPDKGIEDLLEAVAELRGRVPEVLGETPVLVAGSVRERKGVFRVFERRDRSYEAMLRRKVTELGLSETVRFAGHVPPADVPALLGSAVMAVLPYRDASQSGVLNLLLAARTPIVASDLPGLAETLGDAALLTGVGDVHRLADQLARLLGDESLRKALVARMAEVHGRVTLCAVADQLACLYARMATPTAGSPERPVAV